MASRKQLRPDQYTVAWLCALWKTEQPAAVAMLDEEHEDVDLAEGDENVYTLGSINGHNVVIACLSASKPGTLSASRLVEPLRRSFPNTRMHLFVGVGGGVPRSLPSVKPEDDIFLGDVVVGLPDITGAPAVIQYDLGRALAGGEDETFSLLAQPSYQLSQVFTKVMTNHLKRSHLHFSHHLTRTTENIDYDPALFAKPDPKSDRLFKPTYFHPRENSHDCHKCAKSEEVERQRRSNDRPRFLQGTILSGNRVMKDGELRDKLSRKYYNAPCFEMEAAGVMDQTHCLVIRGISDYADSHKNWAWQGYAAATAAAFAREFLCTIRPSAVKSLEPNRQESLISHDYPTYKKAHFVDRAALFEEIEAVHRVPDQPAYQKVAVLVGLGGCGKTQLALHYCQRLENHFSAIYWVDATSPTTLHQNFARIASYLGKPQSGPSDDDSNVRFCMDKLDGLTSPWLLIFDNFDDPESFDSSIKKYFPRGNCGSILVTSRVRSADSLGKSIDLTFMSKEEGLRLLFHRNEHLDQAICGALAVEVLARLEHHALGIAQARAYIESRRMDLDVFLKDYETRKEDVLREIPLFSEYRRKTRPDAAVETRLSVFTTFELSFSRMSGFAGVKAAKQHILTLAGFFNRNAISEALFRNAKGDAAWKTMCTDNGDWNSQAFQTALKEMYELCLVQGLRIMASGAEFSLHPLTQEWIKLRDSSKYRGAHATEAMLILSDHLNSIDLPGMSLPERRVHMLHVKAALENDQRYLGPGAHLGEASLISAAQTFGEFYLNQNLFGEHLGLNKRVVDLNESKLGRNHPSILRSLSGIGEALSDFGKLKEAEGVLQEVVKLQEEVLGAKHQDTLTTMSALGRAYYQLRKYDGAQQLFQHIFTTRTELQGLEHRETLRAMRYLGRILDTQKNYKEAGDIFQKILELQMSVLDQKDLDILRTMEDLARVQKNLGMHKEAEEKLREIQELQVGILEKDHLASLRTKELLAHVLGKQGRHEEAEKILRETLELRLKKNGMEDIDTLITISDLALCLARQGEHGEAREWFKETLDLQRKLFGKEHPEVLDTLEDFAWALGAQGRHRESEERYRELLKIQEEVFGEWHPSTHPTMRNIVWLLEQQGQNEAADQLEALIPPKTTSAESNPWERWDLTGRTREPRSDYSPAVVDRALRTAGLAAKRIDSNEISRKRTKIWGFLRNRKSSHARSMSLLPPPPLPSR